MKPICCVICLFFISCTLQRANRHSNAAQPNNVNYFTQKGNAKITGYYSGDGTQTADGLNLSAAYALTNKVAIMASYNYKKENQIYGYYPLAPINPSIPQYLASINLFDSSVINYKRQNIEFGIGYFIPLNKKKTVTYNIYGGMAFGNFVIDDRGLDSFAHNYFRNYTNANTKYFLQGYFNFLAGETFKLSIGGKIYLMQYKQRSTNYTEQELNFFYLDKIQSNNLVYWEPYWAFQLAPAKWKVIKMDFQMSFLSGNPTNYPKIRGFNVSIGLTTDIHLLLKKKN
ncbi:MAG: hypothetical protein J0I09_09880 [Sphingobacteriia bacterium]|nr:hypothetical protein [Sphingobacteriia bacterium]